MERSSQGGHWPDCPGGDSSSFDADVGVGDEDDAGEAEAHGGELGQGYPVTYIEQQTLLNFWKATFGFFKFPKSPQRWDKYKIFNYVYEQKNRFIAESMQRIKDGPFEGLFTRPLSDCLTMVT